MSIGYVYCLEIWDKDSDLYMMKYYGKRGTENNPRDFVSDYKYFGSSRKTNKLYKYIKEYGTSKIFKSMIKTCNSNVELNQFEEDIISIHF